MPTDNIIMTPGPQSEIELSQLNSLIAEQRNCTIDDLCNFVKGGPGSDSVNENTVPAAAVNVPQAAEKIDVLTDQDLAKNYRSQADALYKEAARLRKEADGIDPPKKKTTNLVDAETSF
jgi:hypothetical protein